MTVSVIIVTYNSADCIDHCLQSVSHQRNVDFETIVIDNASTDGTDQHVRRTHPAVRLIVNEQNTGFGSANNQAAAASQGEFIYLLNPDAALIGTDALARLVASMEAKPHWGLAGTRVTSKDGSQETRPETTYPDQHIAANRFVCLPGHIAWVIGASMITRQAAFQGVGGFDQGFFLHSEETDLCLRLRQAGFEIGYFHDVEVRHVGGASESTTDCYAAWMRRMVGLHRFWTKHYSRMDVLRLATRDLRRSSQRSTLYRTAFRLFPARTVYHDKKRRYEAICDASRQLISTMEKNVASTDLPALVSSDQTHTPHHSGNSAAPALNPVNISKPIQRLRLLYLGYAFPPGVSALFPELQPAGHLIETKLIQSIDPRFDVRCVGVSEVNLARLEDVSPISPGLPHALSLLDRPPSIWNWIRSLRKLNRTYSSWLSAGYRPDVIMVCNFSPVYSAFVRRLACQKDRPRLVIYLADSTLLGVTLSALKRLRYRLKPFKWMDDEMTGLYDACVAVSANTQSRFSSQGLPWLWLPNGMDPDRVRKAAPGPGEGPVIFGYFGHAGEHTGLPHLLRLFTSKPRRAELRVCAFGKARQDLEAEYGRHPTVSFHGPFDPEGCVDFGTRCDVLVNPRPILPGNENNFSSKVFEYALTGCCILTSRLSGVDMVLGEDARYFDAEDFECSLEHSLEELAGTPRTELNRRGLATQRHMLVHCSWETQGNRLTDFLEQVCNEEQTVAL